MKHLKYILIALFFINIQAAHADLEVKEVKPSTTTNPCNGEITVDAIGPSDPDKSAGPFTIVLTHPNGLEETFGPFDGTHTFTGLCGGTYIICINNRFDCGACYERVVEDCSDIEVTAEIKHRCCCTNNGEIKLNVTGGEEPFTFKWFEGGSGCSGEIVSTEKDRIELWNTTHCVEITDNRGCTITKTYTVPWGGNGPSLDIDQVKYCSVEDRVTVTITNHVNGHDYTYDWGDGTIDPNGGISNAHNYRISKDTYTLTVTDNVTGCSKRISIKTLTIGTGRVNDAEDLIVLDIDGDDCDDEDYQGKVAFYLSMNWQLDLPFTVETYKGGVLISTKVWKFQTPNTFLYTATELAAGDYCFVFKDNKECMVAEKCVTILCCPDDSGISVEIDRFNCDKNYIEAISNTGDYTNCKYTWTEYSYDGHKGNEEITDIPRISGIFVGRLGEFRKSTICVRMDCGCEEVEDCDGETFKCCKEIDFDLDGGQRTINHMCHGTVGSYVYNGKLTGSIIFKINIGPNSNFRAGSKGLDKYEKRIQSIKWIEPNLPPVENTYDAGSDIITITRTFDRKSIARLEIIDGFGCVFTEWFAVKNIFRLEQNNDEICEFNIYCGTDKVETRNGTIHVTPLSDEGLNCSVVVICDEIPEVETVFHGRKECGKYTLREDKRCYVTCNCYIPELDKYDYPKGNRIEVVDCCIRPEDLYAEKTDCKKACSKISKTDDVKAEICKSVIIKCLSFANVAGAPYWSSENSVVKTSSIQGSDSDTSCWFQTYCEIVINNESFIYNLGCICEDVPAGSPCLEDMEPLPTDQINHVKNRVISIHPNPFSNQFNITIDQTVDYADYNISIYNTLGQEVSFSIQDHPSGFVIDLEGVADNMYFVVIKDGYGAVVHMEKMVSM